MQFSLETYKHAESDVLQNFKQLSMLFNERGETNKIMKIGQQYQELEKNKFQVTVVGEFSRGKSTFINALLGHKVLPSLARPTTTILNTISYGEKPGIRLYFRDESKQPEWITEEQFSELVAPKEPDENDENSIARYQKQVQYIQGIQYADIQYPIEFCKNNVQIIDTPGTNDLDPNREQLTNTIIPKSDAAIFLLSANKILSDSERSFLQDRLLKNDIQKIFFVINFKDDIKTEEERQKIIHHAKTELKKILSHEPRLFMISAKQALNARRKAKGETIKHRRRVIEPWPIGDTGILELEQALADFLQYERGRVKLQKPISRVVRLIDDTKDKQIPTEKASLTNEISGLREKVEAFKPQLTRVKQGGKDALNKIDITLQTKGQALLQWYDKELDEISEAGMAVFKANDYKSPSEISRLIENETAPLERQLHEEKVTRIQQTIESVVEGSSRTINQEWLKIDANLNDLVSIEDKSIVSMEVFKSEETNDESIFDEIYQELGMAWTSSTSFFGKVAIGAGMGIAVAVDTVATVVKAGLSWLFGGGESESDKFHRKLNQQFRETKLKKREAFKSEWNRLTKAVTKRYQSIIDDKVLETEKQLKTLMANNQLEEADVQKRLEVLKRQEARLIVTKEELQETYEGLNPREKAGV